MGVCGQRVDAVMSVVVVCALLFFGAPYASSTPPTTTTTLDSQAFPDSMFVPSVYVVACPKCSSTSLHQYLKAYKNKCYKQEEIDVFLSHRCSKRENYQTDYQRKASTQCKEDPTKYYLYDNSPRNLYSTCFYDFLAGEANKTIIIALRDPVKRLISGLNMDYQKHRFKKYNMDAYVHNLYKKSIGESPITMSCYNLPVLRISTFCSQNRCLYIDMEKFDTSSKQQLDRFLHLNGTLSFPHSNSRTHTIVDEDIPDDIKELVRECGSIYYGLPKFTEFTEAVAIRALNHSAHLKTVQTFHPKQ
uniref:Sulfotransferase domain-containing protein n=1 Tax=Paramoeba aestuarina TaxID=180227 RepID=A0A7S4NLK5_9EUKA|mmetsp:Transcript_20050/g.31411  ORF Transcript_20050/g.31411 Transcript_20050/m.31411 type:complete len:303 (+) Transcript_20050:69-977(+)